MSAVENSSAQVFTRQRAGWAILLFQMLAVAWGLDAIGRFQPFVVPDTPLYADYPIDSLEKALKNHRTPAYPLFLRAISRLSSGFQAVPAAHYVLYCVAVAFFFLGLLAIQQAPIRCALIAGTLLYSNVLLHFVNEVGADCLAASGAIACIGFVLLRLGGHFRWAALCGLALATFLTWLTRPAYLFLILLVPLICLTGRDRTSGTDHVALRWQRGAEVAVAMLLPLLAYCTLQWAVVGRFAVVSLGGYNLIGISGQFLDEDSLALLPEHLQPLGSQALQNRQRMADRLAMPDASRLNYLRMENQYDDHLWRIFVPAAEDVAGQETHDQINTQLKEMATAIIRLKPRDYLTWLAKAFRRGVEKIVTEFVLNPVSLLLFLLALVVMSVGIAQSFSGQQHPVTLSRQTGLLFILALCFAFMKLGVVILVSIPIERLTMPMGLFVPAVVMAFLTDAIPQIVSRRHALRHLDGTPPQ